ncbi:MAG TPA: RodZ domain-containing protein [Trueperaceae bacterium]|nr:RodZ domain-containing protein [Trueperaceae bacterium]
MSDERRIDPAATGRPQGLGEMFRSARESRGLSLADVAELTHVRQEYLRALEEGRYDDLPEDVYVRNFVRLFAQAVGLDSERALSAYQSERKQAGGLSTLEMRLEQERRGERPPPRRRKPAERRDRSGFSLGPLIPTLVLVAGLAALAVWGFNRLMAPARPTGTTQPPPVVAPEGGAPQVASPDAPAAGDASASQPTTVLVSVVSDPPGATVSIDSFVLPGTTPIRDVPVTARAGRVLSVTLDGYQTLQQPVDLLEDQTLTVTLVPQATAAAAGDAPPAAAATGAGQLAIEVTAPTWLEVYRGTARNQGERLVYRTAQAGETFTFDLPVYVHVGNAAGVQVTQGDTVIGTLGSSGAVVGRAFTAQ